MKSGDNKSGTVSESFRKRNRVMEWIIAPFELMHALEVVLIVGCGLLALGYFLFA